MPRKKADPAFVYVLGAVTRNGPLTYVGWTNDVEARLARHNAGKGARFTRGRVWVLLHAEACVSKRHAMSREWHLKRDRALRKQLSERLDDKSTVSAASAGGGLNRSNENVQARTLLAIGPVSPIVST